MQYDKIAKSYKAQSVQTASPGKLVLMLFDGYLRFTTAAHNSFEESDLNLKTFDLPMASDLGNRKNSSKITVITNNNYYAAQQSHDQELIEQSTERKNSETDLNIKY